MLASFCRDDSSGSKGHLLLLRQGWNLPEQSLFRLLCDLQSRKGLGPTATAAADSRALISSGLLVQNQASPAWWLGLSHTDRWPHRRQGTAGLGPQPWALQSRVRPPHPPQDRVWLGLGSLGYNGAGGRHCSGMPPQGPPNASAYLPGGQKC